MPLKTKDKQLLYQPYRVDTHFECIQKYKNELAIELRFRKRKKSELVTFQWDHIAQVGKTRIAIIIPNKETKQEITYVIGYDDILSHRYIELDKATGNENQDIKKED